ncbi:MAG: hypothetical protein E6J54_15060 [Deltaproteobacteria bacterium]|nr:MAG: hypothetical protein E6J54_15060 [Deltaproteobacteria bacterium]
MPNARAPFKARQTAFRVNSTRAHPWLKRNPVRITEVRIRPTNAGRVKARVSITINNSFMIRDLKVIRLKRGYFVQFPRKRQPDSSYAEIAVPINAEARSMIEEAAFAEFEKVTGEHTAR